MANTRFFRIFYGAVMLVLLILVTAFNIFNLHEAYGRGPPYYSRTTNMDKWSDPLPLLALIDVATILALAAYLYLLRKKH